MSCCLRLSAWSLIWNSAAARMALRWKHILKVWHRMAWHWRKAFLKLGWTWSFLCFLCFLFCVFCDSLRLWASDPLFRSVLDAFHMQNLKQSSRVESLKIHRAKLWSRFGNAEISCWNVQRKQPCKVQHTCSRLTVKASRCRHQVCFWGVWCVWTLNDQKSSSNLW